VLTGGTHTRVELTGLVDQRDLEAGLRIIGEDFLERLAAHRESRSNGDVSLNLTFGQADVRVLIAHMEFRSDSLVPSGCFRRSNVPVRDISARKSSLCLRRVDGGQNEKAPAFARRGLWKVGGGGLQQ